MYHCLDLLKSKWNDVSVKYDLESENVTPYNHNKQNCFASSFGEC